MAGVITTRDELIEYLALYGWMGSAQLGALDGIFESGGEGAVTVAGITDAGATGRAVLRSADAVAARAAMGAGTSNLTVGTTATTALAGNTTLLAIGTTATTAKAGNYTPTAAEVGTALKAKAQIAALAAVAVPDATDLPTAQALANANKAAINAIIAALKA